MKKRFEVFVCADYTKPKWKLQVVLSIFYIFMTSIIKETAKKKPPEKGSFLKKTYLRMNRTPKVFLPQWEEMVHPARVIWTLASGAMAFTFSAQAR